MRAGRVGANGGAMYKTQLRTRQLRATGLEITDEGLSRIEASG
jgi:hypothetical protein